MIGEKIRRILFNDLYKKIGSARQPSNIQIASGGEHLERLKKAEEVLTTVIIPGYDYDLVTSGAVKRLRLSYDMSTIYVIIDYSGSDPGCNFCRFINWQVWRRILEDAEGKLRDAGFSKVVFIDWSTGAVIQYRSADRQTAA